MLVPNRSAYVGARLAGGLGLHQRQNGKYCWRTASWERADPVGQRYVLKERRDTTATQGGDTTTSNCAAFRIPLLTARSNT